MSQWIAIADRYLNLDHITHVEPLEQHRQSTASSPVATVHLTNGRILTLSKAEYSALRAVIAPPAPRRPNRAAPVLDTELLG